MDTFVINLEERPDRWKSIQKRFRNNKFKLRRFTPIQDNSAGYSLFLTTIEILKIAKRKRLANILIIEDDCLPVENFSELWEKVKGWLDSHKDNWDIYSGGAQNIHFPKFVGEAEGVKFYDPLWSTAAHFMYVPSRSYNKIIDHYGTYKYATKVIPFLNTDVHNNLFKNIISYPFLAYQDSGYSNVSKTRRNRKKDFKDAERGLSKVAGLP